MELSACILKAVEFEREREGKDDSKVFFGLNDWKNRAAIYHEGEDWGLRGR